MPIQNNAQAYADIKSLFNLFDRATAPVADSEGHMQARDNSVGQVYR
jgi:hypothetical protein